MPTKIVGHERQRKNLRRLFSQNRLPTTLMFSGIHGIGKLPVARELYRTFFCDINLSQKTVERFSDTVQYGGCGSCQGCHLFDIGNTPDLHIIECIDKGVKDIREMLYSLSLRPFSGSYRVVIFNDAEHLNLHSTNALLKALEEPRPGTFFCLISANPYGLPKTLLSRCQIWFFDSLSDKEIEQILKEKLAEELDDSNLKIEDVAVLADGSMANIESIVQNYDSWNDLTEKLSAIFKGDLKTAHILNKELSQNKETLREKIRLMRIFARMQMLDAEGEDAQTKWAITLSNLLSSERLLFQRNLAPSYVLSYLFLNLVSDNYLNSFARSPGSDTLLGKQVV